MAAKGAKTAEEKQAAAERMAAQQAAAAERRAAKAAAHAKLVADRAAAKNAAHAAASRAKAAELAAHHERAARFGAERVAAAKEWLAKIGGPAEWAEEFRGADRRERAEIEAEIVVALAGELLGGERHVSRSGSTYLETTDLAGRRHKVRIATHDHPTVFAGVEIRVTGDRSPAAVARLARIRLKRMAEAEG